MPEQSYTYVVVGAGLAGTRQWRASDRSISAVQFSCSVRKRICPTIAHRCRNSFGPAASPSRQARRPQHGRAREPFTYMPFFFSDLFEFGYEAVGDVDSRLRNLCRLAGGEQDRRRSTTSTTAALRGAMMCNVWGKVDAARDLIQADRPSNRARDLRGAIRSKRERSDVSGITDRDRHEGLAGRGGARADQEEPRWGITGATSNPTIVSKIIGQRTFRRPDRRTDRARP